MHIENLSLLNFKNYHEMSISFSPQINCFVGSNGSGKTNLLDAIHYLCLTKSAFNFTDSQLILHKENHFIINGKVNMGDEQAKVASSFQTGKKVFKFDNQIYDRLSEHIGKMPLVIISPNDNEIVQEGGEIRRRFFDNILCQYDKEYLTYCILYAKYIKNRNALLKQFAERRYVDRDLLEPFDNELIRLSKLIYEKRKEMLKEFKPIFDFSYLTLSDQAETIELIYKSPVSDVDFKQNFKKSLEKDIFLQRTTLGVHKDDYNFVIDEQPLKKFGSQGQQKTYIIALKLGMFKLLEKKKRMRPVLLLDDIFDRLDPVRVQRLINMLARGHAGQVFISDTDAKRTMDLFRHLKQDIRFFEVNNAKIKQLETTEEIQ